MKFPEIKMGTAKRFSSINSAQATPGAVYDPPFPLHKPGQPKYSFGKAPSKKIQGRNVELQKGTPANLGPNSYFKAGYPEHLVRDSSPQYQLPKALRNSSWASRSNVNETYEI